MPINDFAVLTNASLSDAVRYRAVGNHYVAPFDGINDLCIALLHLLHSECAGLDNRDHMAAAHRLVEIGPVLLLATQYRRIDLADLIIPEFEAHVSEQRIINNQGYIWGHRLPERPQ